MTGPDVHLVGLSWFCFALGSRCASERAFGNAWGLVIVEDRVVKSKCECIVVDVEDFRIKLRTLDPLSLCVHIVPLKACLEMLRAS